MKEEQDNTIKEKKTTRYFWWMVLAFPGIGTILWLIKPFAPLLFIIGFALSLAAIIEFALAVNIGKKTHWFVWLFLFAPIWLVIGFFFFFVFVFTYG